MKKLIIWIIIFLGLWISQSFAYLEGTFTLTSWHYIVASTWSTKVYKSDDTLILNSAYWTLQIYSWFVNWSNVFRYMARSDNFAIRLEFNSAWNPIAFSEYDENWSIKKDWTDRCLPWYDSWSNRYLLASDITHITSGRYSWNCAWNFIDETGEWVIDMWVNISWPPPLAFTSTWEITPIQDWFTLSWSIINVDYKITNIEILEYYAWTAIQTDSDIRILSQTWSWWVEVDLDILSDADFTFQAFQDYEIKITFETLDWLESIYNWYTYWDYNYNEWYSEPVEWNFSFLVSWYTFFENWFSLDNFIPTPSWWLLYFDIIAPVVWWTWTVDLTTETYLPYEISWNWYWIDSSVRVTYPYHQVSWIYQVRTVYQYEDLIIYPFWEDYNSYNITVAERPNDEYIWDPEWYECDDDLDWFITTAEQANCATNLFVKYWLLAQDRINSLIWLFRTLLKIWQTEEEKSFFSFLIPWVYSYESTWTWFTTAFDNRITEYSEDTENETNKMLKFFFYWLLLVLVILAFKISFNKD
jgi:hypothetical protein